VTDTAHRTATGALPSVAELERMYWVMVTTTLADARAQQEAKAGRLQAAFYPVRGMEAVCAALGVVLQPRDRLVSTYRNLGDAVAKGVPLKSIVAELYGRVDGVSKGKGGPMHLQDDAAGLTATTGVVGSGLPIAAGLGIAAQLDGDGKVVAVTFGDGATSIGAFHEAMNMAALWRLPVLFVCQNNQWAISEPTERQSRLPLYQRARGYGFPGIRVDGNDVLGCLAVTRWALEACRHGNGPVLIEAFTYRMDAHTTTDDPTRYRLSDEVETWKLKDPIERVRVYLTRNGGADASFFEQVEAEADEFAADLREFVFNMEDPPPERIFDNVYAEPSAQLEAQREEFLAYLAGFEGGEH